MTPITLPNAQPIHIGRMPPRRDLDGVLARQGLPAAGLHRSSGPSTESWPTYNSGIPEAVGRQSSTQTLPKKGRESSHDSRPFRPSGASRTTDARYGSDGGFLPLLATKLTQSPWFLNTPKVFQPPFLHSSIDVGSGTPNSILATKASSAGSPRRGWSGRPLRLSGNWSRTSSPSHRRCPRRPRRCRGRYPRRCRPGTSNRPARIRSRLASSQRRRKHRRRGSFGRPLRSSGNRSRPCSPSRRRCPRRPRR